MSGTGLPVPPVEPDYSDLTSWVKNDNPKHLSFPVHGRHVVTCLLIISRGRVVTAGDDAEIYVYSLSTGKQIHSLKGHEGGVWTVKAYKETLVSGSTDKTVRVWDLKTGECMHVFGGHTSTVRCLEIVKPEEVDWTDEDGVRRREHWPKEPLIVSGSRDNTLRVWTLPKPDEEKYQFTDMRKDPSEEDATKNPYYRFVLEGHEHAVRALDARGRTVVSGSYDTTVRVWDIITGKCKWVLAGHTHKVYSAVLDLERDQVYSGSMDSTVRIWSLSTGQCSHTLLGHTSLVGLLGFSPSYLVSAAADATIRIWDPETGELQHVLQNHRGAITCFQHDESKALSGSDGTLKIWNVKSGAFVKDLLVDVVGVWQVAFKGPWCVAASSRQDRTVLDSWDFSRTAVGGEEYGDIEDSFSVGSDERQEDG